MTVSLSSSLARPGDASGSETVDCAREQHRAGRVGSTSYLGHEGSMVSHRVGVAAVAAPCQLRIAKATYPIQETTRDGARVNEPRYSRQDIRGGSPEQKTRQPASEPLHNTLGRHSSPSLTKHGSRYRQISLRMGTRRAQPRRRARAEQNRRTGFLRSTTR